MRAVGYVRPGAIDAAGAAGATGQSAQTDHRSQFEQYCRDRGQELTAVIAPGPEGQPGRLTDEQQFESLVRMCADGTLRPDVVLLPDSPHLASDLDTYVDRILWLEEHGIEVRCVSSPLADALENGLKLLKAAARTAERTSRIRDAIASKAQRGEVLGRTPYGYRVGLDGVLEPVESETPIVKEVFDLYTRGQAPDAGGTGTAEPLGLRRIAGILNARGLRTRAGGLWTTVSLNGVLRNPVYTGYYRRRNVRLPGNHPGIVDRTVFEMAQRAMLERRPHRRARTREEYVLAGLARCAACGRAMHGLLRERTWKRKDGTEARGSYRYYECPARAHGGGSRNDHASQRAEALERAVFGRVGEVAGEAGGVDETSFITLPGKSPGDAVESEVRRVRTAISRIAAGTGQIAEFTTARARLRRARAAARSEAPVRMSVRQALEAATGSDRELARRAVRALVSGISVGVAAVDVQLRTEQAPAAS